MKWSKLKWKSLSCVRLFATPWTIHGILQARILEWVAFPFSRSSQKWSEVNLLSHVQLFTTPWTAASQAPPSMGFSRQEYWSGLPFPSPGDLPDSGIEPGSPSLQVDALPSKPPGKPWSSQTRDQTQISCIAGGFFTSWATREALIHSNPVKFVLKSLWFHRKTNWRT